MRSVTIQTRRERRGRDEDAIQATRFFAESTAQFHAAEMFDIGLTARLVKVTIKGCRASDTRTFFNAV
jgi:hypothetical protein